MNIQLSQEFTDYIENCVKSGLYQSQEEVIRSALRLIMIKEGETINQLDKTLQGALNNDIEQTPPRKEFCSDSINSNYLLCVDEAAKFLGVKKETLAIWRCEKRYTIPFIKVGRLVKYKRSDLIQFIEKRVKS